MKGIVKDISPEKHYEEPVPARLYPYRSQYYGTPGQTDLRDPGADLGQQRHVRFVENVSLL